MDPPMNKSQIPSVRRSVLGYLERGGLSRINGCEREAFGVVAVDKRK